MYNYIIMVLSYIFLVYFYKNNIIFINIFIKGAYMKKIIILLSTLILSSCGLIDDLVNKDKNKNTNTPSVMCRLHL